MMPAPTISETLTANVRAQMLQKNMAVAELAHSLGISIDRANRCLSGKKEWTLSQLVLLGNAFGLQAHKLLGTENDLPPCPVYTWCYGHGPADDPDAHCGTVGYAVAGESQIETSVNIANGDIQYEVDFGTWYIRAEDIDSEIADLESILHQIRFGLKKFTIEVTDHRAELHAVTTTD